ncbi:type II secretion system protein [Tannockella kyphosi]|uniref:type II secretion system protein n=1 Tax=Tannockella kyphosi TaxID=2899121 RepID=UPI0024B368A4|nr:type II secretion system protein [Tannockella kyphosi]
MIKQIKKTLKNNKGFTLIELMVVVVILLILAAIAVPSFTGLIDEANETAAIAEARSVLLFAQFEADLAAMEGEDQVTALADEWSQICSDAGVDENDATYSFDASDGSLIIYYYFDNGAQCVTMPGATVSTVVN